MPRRFLLICAISSIASAASPLAATNLRTEYLSSSSALEPVLINSVLPRFSWEPQHTDRGVVQSQYHITVTRTTPPSSVVWDSGVVNSSATSQVAYSGTALEADTVYTWNVVWVDGAGSSAPASESASFATGPGDDAAWNAAGAQWIGCSGSIGNQLRLEFPTLPPSAGATIAQARLYVSGLGWHISFLNGERLGKSVLEPAFTNLRERVLFVAHDVTRLLSTSSTGNAFAAYLGHGWPEILAPWGPNNGTGVPPWNGSTTRATAGAAAARVLPTRESMISLTQAELDSLIADGYGHGHTGYEQRLRAWLSIRWSDGSSSSMVTSAAAMGGRREGAAAGEWQCGMGSLVSDDLYAGCTIDARLETDGWLLPGYNYSTGSWATAVRIAEPGGKMVPASFPAVEIVNLLAPRSMWASGPSSFVFDMAQNFAGGVRLSLPGPTPRGVTIVVRHAEAILHPPYGPRNGSLYYGNLRSAEATDTYITRGSADGETFEPMFTWHGFRYVEVTGLPFVPSLTGVVTGINFRSAVPSVGSIAFPASASVLDQLQHAVFWGQASNLMGNPSDCPQRDERLGWTGDSALTNEESAWNFDMSAFYTHWADTIADSLLVNNVDRTFKYGGLPETIPDITGGYDADASWSSVWPSTVHTLWKAYADTRAAAAFWPGLLAYVNHTSSSWGSGAKVFATWG